MRLLILASTAGLLATMATQPASAADRGRFAHSDSDARYVHWIDLYDTANRKITEASTLPYSPLNTCGRCHDYESISHGWHFNAFSADSDQGRQSEPWIWTDSRTGTQLPLSYRKQDDSQTNVFDPRVVGISPWLMTSQFGARFPGGGFGEKPQATAGGASAAKSDNSPADISPANNSPADNAASPRWSFSGSLEVDCMVCHASSGAYDFESRRSQISDENFAWAPTAALHLASIDGNVSRIKDDADPTDEKTNATLPKTSYDTDRFASDGKVFFDVIREPENNACYQCHSSLAISDNGIEPRWTHDEDIHLRAGMLCIDCHRNGIEHHTVRGYEGETSPTGALVTTLSCSGCHLGTESLPLGQDIASLAGRLGSPKPLHAGLPPVHFERLSCTACHAGPAPRGEAIRMMTSLAHSLGASEHRSGQEPPLIQGPVYTKLANEKIYPQRVMWPAYWGTVDGDSIKPLSPANVYDWTRKSLRVRKDFVEEIASDQEKFDEKVSESLAAIEKETGSKQAVYVSTGRVFARASEDSGKASLQALSTNVGATEMVSWPIAHNVRPAGWSLGAGGCLECHSDSGKIFESTVTPLGPAPTVAEPIVMASLQGIDVNQRLLWNQMFGGRANFKVLVALSLTTVFAVLLIGLGSAATLLTRRQPIALKEKA